MYLQIEKLWKKGFIEAQVCITALIESVDVWTRLFDVGMAVDVVNLEYATPVDSVSPKKVPD